jgi:hypothetical protein
MKLGGLQCRSGRLEEEKNFFPLQGIKHRFFGCLPGGAVTKLTTLTRLKKVNTPNGTSLLTTLHFFSSMGIVLNPLI